MQERTNTLLAGLLIVGLAIGLFVGYSVAPAKVETITETVTVTQHPLADTTLTLGFIEASTPQTERDFTVLRDLASPDIQDYLKKLGYNLDFEILLDDAQGKPELHLEKIQALKVMDISLVLGAQYSSHAQAALSYVNENNIFLLSSSSTSLSLAIANDNLYRLCVTDAVNGLNIATRLWSWGIEAIVVIGVGDAWGDGLYDILNIEYPKTGGVILDRYKFTRGTKEFSSYLTLMNSRLNEAIATYGIEHVGVVSLAPGAEEVTILQQSADYPTLQSVIWMGAEASGKRQEVIDYAGEEAIQVRHFGAGLIPTNSWKWERHEARMLEEIGYLAHYYTGALEDTAWTMVNSVLESSSTDASDVIKVYPKVTSSYFGATGWIDLNEYGDRKSGEFAIFGYALIDGEPGFMTFGKIDPTTMEAVWDLKALQSQGLNPPGH